VQRRSEHPAVFAAELGWALVADMEAEAHDLRERIESRKGLRQLSYMKEL